MSNIQKYNQQLPDKLSKALVSFLFADSDPDDTIQLKITIDDFSLNIRDFSTYLHFIYKIDGLLSENSFRSYSRMHEKQILITKIEKGSIEILIERLFSEYGAERLVIIWLALKYAPKILNGVLDTIHQYYDTLLKREEYLEKKERRVIRKDIRGLINEEPDLVNLDKKTKEKIVDMVDGLYLSNSNKLKPIAQFGSEKVKSLTIKSKRKNNNR